MNPRCVDNDMNQNEYNGSNKMGMESSMMNMNPGCMCPPVYECPCERVCERYIMHEVPQV